MLNRNHQTETFNLKGVMRNDNMEWEWSFHGSTETIEKASDMTSASYQQIKPFNIHSHHQTSPSHPIWVNYNISLTWIKAIWGWFPLLTMIIVRSQWGRYNLPRSHHFPSLSCIQSASSGGSHQSGNHPSMGVALVVVALGGSGSTKRP